MLSYTFVSKHLESCQLCVAPPSDFMLTAHWFFLVKRIAHQKITICWKSILHRRWPEGVSLLKQIQRNFAKHHLLTNGSSKVNGCHRCGHSESGGPRQNIEMGTYTFAHIYLDQPWGLFSVMMLAASQSYPIVVSNISKVLMYIL